MVRIEIIAIGSEILKGLIVNSNASEISKILLLAGYKTQRHTVVPDDPEALKLGMVEALSRSDIVITTGGLGPTCDDITREIAADIFNSDFYFNQEIANSLLQRYGSNAPISLENQATIPSKAIPLRNDLGTAPGLIFHTDTKALILLQGVPREMRAILTNQVIPYLKKHYPRKQYKSKLLHFFELSESSIDPILRELQDTYPEIEFGIYPSQGTVSVQMTVETENTLSAQSNLSAACDKLLQHFGNKQFESATGKLEDAVYELFVKNNWTLSVAESCTGGGIAARLTKVPGSSKYFIGGIVSYCNRLKQSLLHVPESTLLSYGAVSEETVCAMAIGALDATKSDFSLAISGVAGPSGGTDDKPVGMVWLAIMKRGEKPVAHCLRLHGNRDIIIERSINAAMSSLLTKIITGCDTLSAL